MSTLDARIWALKMDRQCLRVGAQTPDRLESIAALEAEIERLEGEARRAAVTHVTTMTCAKCHKPFTMVVDGERPPFVLCADCSRLLHGQATHAANGEF